MVDFAVIQHSFVHASLSAMVAKCLGLCGRQAMKTIPEWVVFASVLAACITRQLASSEICSSDTPSSGPEFRPQRNLATTLFFEGGM